MKQTKELKKTKEILDQLLEKHILKTEKFESSKIFFNQLLMCVREDSYEFISTIQKKTKLPKQFSLSPQLPKIKIDANIAAKIFDYFAIYNIICFFKKDGEKFDNSAIELQFFSIFDLADEQISVYAYFMDKFEECDGYFKDEFSKTVYKHIFSEDLQSIVFLAYMSNSLYNSYKSFLESYTHYIPLNTLSEDML